MLDREALERLGLFVRKCVGMQPSEIAMESMN
jgi:hypothetical protein